MDIRASSLLTWIKTLQMQYADQMQPCKCNINFIIIPTLFFKSSLLCRLHRFFCNSMKRLFNRITSITRITRIHSWRYCHMDDHRQGKNQMLINTPSRSSSDDDQASSYKYIHCLCRDNSIPNLSHSSTHTLL